MRPTTAVITPPPTADVAEIPSTSISATSIPESTSLPNPPKPNGFEPKDLTPEELMEIQPNELGGIPVFMYHNIVSDASLEGHLYRTQDELYGDLQWLYDNDFYLTGMNDMVRGHFVVPAGKHPVVLTFDDSSSMHFSFVMGPDDQPAVDDNGEYLPTPLSAVGIIESFADEHPDFGRTAHFGTIPQFKFSWPEYEQDEWYDAKVQWLVSHGYEIGNHTSDHGPLSEMTIADFERNIAEPYVWIGDIVDKNEPGFAMGVITLPFGDYPEGGWDGRKFDDLAEGFEWEGHDIAVTGAMLVCCGPAPSPFDTEYRRLWIPRIRGDDPDYASLEESILNDWVILYTSDGNPDTVTVPWPLPNYFTDRLDEDAVAERGLTLVKYNPETGTIDSAAAIDYRQAYTRSRRARVSG